MEDLAKLSDSAGIYGAILIGCGLASAAIAGPLLDCTHWYRSFYKTFFVLTVAAWVGLLLEMRPSNEMAIGIWFGATGFFCIPLLPIAIETAVECTYPVPEEISTMVLQFVGNMLGLAFTYAQAQL